MEERLLVLGPGRWEELRRQVIGRLSFSFNRDCPLPLMGHLPMTVIGHAIPVTARL